MATSNEYLPDPEAHPSGLYVFGVSDPAHPTPLGAYQTTGGARAVAVAGARAYVTVWPPATLEPGRLEVVSVADPLHPASSGYYTSTLLKPYDVQVAGERAYVAATYGLWAFALADPDAPALLGADYGESAKAVHVVGERAYLAREGVSVVSVADPARLTELGAYPLADAEDVYAAGDTIYVANGEGGLVVLRVAEPSAIAGRVLDGRGAPLAGVRISAGGAYSATTGADGVYTITGLLPGAYTLTPATAGYFWSPESRTVTVPPGTGGQDFVGQHVRKQASPAAYRGALGLDDPLTYTLHLVYPEDGELVVYDPLPPVTHTRYVSGSLNVPELAYDPRAHAITGTLGLAAGEPATVTFAVRVAVQGTAGFAPALANRACVHRPGEGLAGCQWSNEVVHYTYLRQVYLPLLVR